MNILSIEGEELQRLVSGGVVWDNHSCMPLRPRDDRFMSQLEKCRAAGINLITLNVGYGSDGIEEHIRMLAFFRDWIKRHADQYRLVLTPADVELARSSGQLGICFDIEGMNAVADQSTLVRLYYDLGVRWMLVAYNLANQAGGGCLGEDPGLTEFGRQIVKEMNEVGMVLCCSHTGYNTARAAIDLSSDPVIFSHSNARSVFDHPRNIPDDLMRACSARGGVIGLNGLGVFLGKNDASTETFVRHLEHVLDVVGEDHVGIGLDYCFDQEEVAAAIAAHPEAYPPEFFPRGEPLAQIPPWRLNDVARMLSSHGCTSQTLAKIFGGNHMRVAMQVWK